MSDKAYIIWSDFDEKVTRVMDITDLPTDEQEELFFTAISDSHDMVVDCTSPEDKPKHREYALGVISAFQASGGKIEKKEMN